MYLIVLGDEMGGVYRYPACNQYNIVVSVHNLTFGSGYK
jgi:hypothetical protein